MFELCYCNGLRISFKICLAEYVEFLLDSFVCVLERNFNVKNLIMDLVEFGWNVNSLRIAKENRENEFNSID